jgi:hypothetical protein
MPRTTYVESRAGFIVDHNSMESSEGRQIDWANVAVGYVDSATGKKVIPAGTVMGELLGGGKKISPRVVTTNPAVGILATNAVEGDRADSYSGYGMYIGGVVYEALLPDSTGSPKTLPAAMKTELNTAGCTFKYRTYEDNRT